MAMEYPTPPNLDSGSKKLAGKGLQAQNSVDGLGKAQRNLISKRQERPSEGFPSPPSTPGRQAPPSEQTARTTGERGRETFSVLREAPDDFQRKAGNISSEIFHGLHTSHDIVLKSGADARTSLTSSRDKDRPFRHLTDLEAQGSLATVLTSKKRRVGIERAVDSLHTERQGDVQGYSPHEHQLESTSTILHSNLSLLVPRHADLGTKHSEGNSQNEPTPETSCQEELNSSDHSTRFRKRISKDLRPCSDELEVSLAMAKRFQRDTASEKVPREPRSSADGFFRGAAQLSSVNSSSTHERSQGSCLPLISQEKTDQSSPQMNGECLPERIFVCSPGMREIRKARKRKHLEDWMCPTQGCSKNFTGSRDTSGDNMLDRGCRRSTGLFSRSFHAFTYEEAVQADRKTYSSPGESGDLYHLEQEEMETCQVPSQVCYPVHDGQPTPEMKVEDASYLRDPRTRAHSNERNTLGPEEPSSSRSRESQWRLQMHGEARLEKGIDGSGKWQLEAEAEAERTSKHKDTINEEDAQLWQVDNTLPRSIHDELQDEHAQGEHDQEEQLELRVAKRHPSGCLVPHGNDSGDGQSRKPLQGCVLQFEDSYKPCETHLTICNPVPSGLSMNAEKQKSDPGSSSEHKLELVQGLERGVPETDCASFPEGDMVEKARQTSHHLLWCGSSITSVRRPRDSFRYNQIPDPKGPQDFGGDRASAGGQGKEISQYTVGFGQDQDMSQSNEVQRKKRVEMEAKPFRKGGHDGESVRSPQISLRLTEDRPFDNAPRKAKCNYAREPADAELGGAMQRQNMRPRSLAEAADAAEAEPKECPSRSLWNVHKHDGCFDWKIVCPRGENPEGTAVFHRSLVFHPKPSSKRGSVLSKLQRAQAPSHLRADAKDCDGSSGWNSSRHDLERPMRGVSTRSLGTEIVRLLPGGRAACPACGKVVKRISLMQHVKHGRGCHGIPLTESEYSAAKFVTSQARAAYMRKYREPKRAQGGVEIDSSKTDGSKGERSRSQFMRQLHNNVDGSSLCLASSEKLPAFSTVRVQEDCEAMVAAGAGSSSRHLHEAPHGGSRGDPSFEPTGEFQRSGESALRRTIARTMCGVLVSGRPENDDIPCEETTDSSSSMHCARSPSALCKVFRKHAATSDSLESSRHICGPSKMSHLRTLLPDKIERCSKVTLDAIMGDYEDEDTLYNAEYSVFRTARDKALWDSCSPTQPGQTTLTDHRRVFGHIGGPPLRVSGVPPVKSPQLYSSTNECWHQKVPVSSEALRAARELTRSQAKNAFRVIRDEEAQIQLSLRASESCSLTKRVLPSTSPDRSERDSGASDSPSTRCELREDAVTSGKLDVKPFRGETLISKPVEEARCRRRHSQSCATENLPSNTIPRCYDPENWFRMSPEQIAAAVGAHAEDILRARSVAISDCQMSYPLPPSSLRKKFFPKGG